MTGETEIAENVAATGITEVDTDTPVGDQETADNPDGEAEVAGTMPLEAIAVVKNVAPDAPVEIATTAVAPEGEAQIAPSNTPKATATPADAEAAPPTAVAAPQVATTKSAPTIVTDQSAEAEPVSLEPVQANNSRTANTNSTQTQTPQPAPTQPTATIPADAKSAATSDPDSQFPQQPTAPQADQLKPQQANASRPPEAPSLPAPTADASAPKIQINTAAPAVTPEPVRALAASLNPASLHAANVNEPNPVPLTGTALAVEIVSRMRDGLKRFDIRLDPPELGRVDVRLEVDRNGHATTRLTVDRPETLDLLQRDARGLERALQQAGLKTDQGGLEFTLRQQTNDAATDGRPGSSEPRPDLLAGDEVERIEAVIEGYRSAAHARGGVDIRI
ncbi:MAG: flagellar hook-length control protein FliK [Xanthobacteraceae bacterium]